MELVKGCWIAIDGRDAVGKSTQVLKVTEKLIDQGINPVKGINEFSDSHVGRTINGILEENRFFALDKNKTTPLSDTLMLLSDMVYQKEYSIMPTLRKNGIVISDRGPASFIAYQSVRINQRSAEFDQKQAYRWCSQLVRNCELKPNLTLLINISNEEMQRRVLKRENNPLSPDDLDFLNKVNNILPVAAQEHSQYDMTINGEIPVDELNLIITNLILNFISQKK